MVKTAAFDAADYLNDEETIAAYLTAVTDRHNRATDDRHIEATRTGL